jgi:hypothetical protein
MGDLPGGMFFRQCPMPSTRWSPNFTPLKTHQFEIGTHRRLRIEHVNSSVKRCRVVKDRIRLWKEGVRDVVMEICCALHNFRVRLSPWQPMI